ncbi:MAG: DUF5706 domain-containing protein [Campylobacterota bacterium]|nr:DUF5706 domain-containing protein [Campylobacterota bacterium]
MEESAKNRKVIDVETNVSIMYLLRAVQQNHLQLTMMADRKASTLLAACFIITSLVAGYTIDKGLTPVAVVIALFTVLSAFFGLLASIPRLVNGEKSGKERNLLFFGDYAGMEVESYLKVMNESITTDQQIYQMMIEDIYSMGKVLTKKYRYIRLSYLMFIAGIIAPLVTIVVLEFLPFS